MLWRSRETNIRTGSEGLVFGKTAAISSGVWVLFLVANAGVADATRRMDALTNAADNKCEDNLLITQLARFILVPDGRTAPLGFSKSLIKKQRMQHLKQF